MNEENRFLKDKLASTEQTAKATRIKANEIDNHLRCNNIELHGVPIYKQENVERIAVSILKIADSKITKEDIDMVRRTGNPKNVDGSSKTSLPIMVRLKSRERVRCSTEFSRN